MSSARTTIPHALDHAARTYPETEALVDGATRFTYRELRREVAAVTKSLMALGVGPGDRIGLWAPNSARWVTLALAAAGAGAVLVPVNTRYKGAEARWLLERSRARVLCVADGFLGNDYLAMIGAGTEPGSGPVPGLPALEHVVALTDEAPDSATVTAWDTFVRLGARVTDDEAAARTAGVDEDDVSDVLFTSGTTGRPKGVLTTHRQNVLTYRAWSDRTGLVHGDRYLIVNPMFHCFGYKAGLLACVLRGATMVLQAVFDVARTLELVQEESITVLPGPPTIYTSLLDAAGREDHDLSSLRLAVTGAAVVPVTLVERLRAELFPAVITAYGLTEASGTVTTCQADDDAETIAHTSGRPIDGVEIRVTDATGRALPPGQDGEILVRGHNVMRGYLDDPEATAATLDPDGWLDTGDVGHLDAQGRLTLTGRSKEMFTVGGFNVYPAEVEQALARHESVAEAAVTSAPDHRLGEVGRAYVTLRPGSGATPDTLLGHCREQLANFKVPREIVVVDDFPRNAAGKISKSDLGPHLATRRGAPTARPTAEQGGRHHG